MIIDSIVQLLAILLLIGMVFVTISKQFHERISFNLKLLLLLPNFMNGSRLKLMHIFPTVNIKSTFIHLNDFQQLVLLPQVIAITSFLCNNRINTLQLKQSSDREAYSEPCQTSNIQLKAVNFFPKTLHLKCLTGF